MSPIDLRPEQKAAAFMIALGDEAASALLNYLDEDQVEALAAEMAQLERIKPEVLDQVMTEVRSVDTSPAVSGGMDYVRRLLSGWKGGRGAEIVDELGAGSHPLRDLRNESPDRIASALDGEHPQAAALVIANQSPSFGAAILRALDPEIRSEVALRVARLGEVTPGVLAKVEQTLRGRLIEATPDLVVQRGGGARGLARMLNSTDRGTERSILEGISQQAPDLAEEIRALMFVFEDLVMLDDRAVQRVLTEIEGRVLAVALKGAAEAIKDVILRNMSQRAQETLTEELDLLGPVAKKEVHDAREQVAATVRRLADAEEIVIRRGGGEGDVVE